MKFAVVIENENGNYGAYVPDLPGCVAVGSSLKEVKQLIHEAIELHLETMRDDGESIPTPSTECDYVELDVQITG